MAGEIKFNNVSAPTSNTSGKQVLYGNSDKYLHHKNENDLDAIQLEAFFTSNQNADFTLANSATAQSPFQAANDVCTVAGLTTYIMEGLVVITGMGATTRTTALEFDAGSATLTSIAYEATIATGAANTIYTVAPTGLTAVAATAQVLNATVATAAATIRWKGIVRINAAGTFIPQIKFSADPTGTLLSKKDSFFTLTPVGSNTVASVGSWA